METHSFDIGSDHVTMVGETVIIDAKRRIIDWSVREFHRQPIFFFHRKYYLRTRSAGVPPFAARYELAPWPEDRHDESRQSFIYDEAFVAERDRHFVEERKRDLLWYSLLPLYPLFGLCWSGFKARVLWPLGFNPKSVTSASTMLMFGLTLGDGIMVGYFASGLMSMVIPSAALAQLADTALFVLLFLDCAIRYDQVIRDDEVPDGFLEWLFRWVKN